MRHAIYRRVRSSRRFTQFGAVVAVAAMTSTAGCNDARFRFAERKPASPMVQRPEAKPALTEDQHRQMFHRSYNEGLRLARTGKPGLAIGAFEDALEHDSSSFDAWFNMAACQEQIGDPLAAMRIYQRLLSINPNDADCYANIGTCCIKLYHRESNATWKRMAIESWQRSLELQPRQPDVRRYLASCAPDEQ